MENKSEHIYHPLLCFLSIFVPIKNLTENEYSARLSNVSNSINFFGV